MYQTEINQNHNISDTERFRDEVKLFVDKGHDIAEILDIVISIVRPK